jgi:glycosyltransferase involved in cell wall biosynthesis
MKDKSEKLEILIVPYLIPYPAVDGGRICSFSFIDKLRDRINFSIIFFSNSVNDDENIHILKRLWPNVNIKIFVNYSPKSNLTPSFSQKLNNLLNRFKKKTDILRSYDLLEDLQVTNFYSPRSKNDLEKLERLIYDKKFDLIQIDYTNNLNLVHLLPEKTPKIFVEVESRYSLLYDYINLKPETGLFGKYILKQTQAFEIALISQFDAVFALSEKDKKRIEELLPKQKVYSSPFSVPDTNINYLNENEFRIKKLTFLGPEEHLPNKDAITWFIEEVMIKRETTLNLFIIGNWSHETINKYKDYTNINFTGYVDDLSEHLKNSALVVPIRLGGGGLRTKILMAMAQGTPIISTTIGADGFDFKNHETFLQANNGKEFIDQINFIKDNKKIGFQIALKAQELFNQQYSQDRTADIRFQLYQKIVNQKY